MRLIAVMPIWGREPFVGPALDQAEKLVHEVKVSVCSLHPKLDKFEDGSEAIVRDKAKSSSKIDYVEVSRDDLEGDWSHKMSGLLNRLLFEAKPEEGDLVWLLDSDEFYTQTSQSIIANYIKRHPEFVSLRFKSRFICPDMDHYVLHGHTRLHRYWEGRQFIPTSMFHPLDESVVLLDKAPMFHYSLAVPHGYKEAFWEIEFGDDTPDKQKVKMEWWNKIFQEYDVEDPEPWIRRNEELTGHRGFWFTDNVEEAPGGGLFELKAEHPQIVRDANLPELIGDFRETFPPEDSRPRPKMRFNVRGKDVDPGDLTLIAGPWGGEFGYELMYWTPRLRTLAKEFQQVEVIIPEGHGLLYEFADSITEHTIDLGEAKWAANMGDRKFWTGSWRRMDLPEEELRKIKELEKEYADARDTSSCVFYEPNSTLSEIPPDYRSLRTEGVEPDPSRVLLHCRRAGHGRDWPDEKCDVLARELNKLSLRPGVIGTLDDYLPRASVEDLRGISLEELVEEVSRAFLVIGASSGPMHLAHLCETAVVCWGDADFSIPEVGTSSEAYMGKWNPFEAPIQYINAGWDPEPEQVMAGLKDFVQRVRKDT